jgi:hypothetical protein
MLATAWTQYVEKDASVASSGVPAASWMVMQRQAKV